MITDRIDLSGETVLITGGAGFIGSHLAIALLETVKNITIVGIDNLNDYYDVSLKRDRLAEIEKHTVGSLKKFVFIEGSIADAGVISSVFETWKPSVVVNLAAQAGVRYSITNPDAYMESNIMGFYRILEACRHSRDDGRTGVKHLIYASSSSVYGANKKVPYAVEDMVDSPVSLYAATKKSNELMAHAYSKLYGIPTTGFRFFTVYGPMGRPDMAYFSFTRKMIAGEVIQIFNHGDMYRDFTYVDDIITAMMNVLGKAPELNENGVPYKVYNIGNNKPESLLYFVDTLEKILLREHMISRPAKREFLPMQPGDVYQTYADVDSLMRDFAFRPSTDLKTGLENFVKWYRQYYAGQSGSSEG